MIHPIKQKIERANWWRDHLKDRCHPMVMYSANHRVLISDIQRIVARYYSIPEVDFLSKTKERRIVRPRQVAMFLSRRFTKKSYPFIGSKFAGTDHSNVMYAVALIDDLMKHDPELSDDIDNLARQIAHGK